ncbi:MAG: YihY/virulence factor BrkB family protein [Dehalococcoidia bacterium]|nr:YihY/virulence factor BrkB family protein [Dehalococcoidia bacterium]
MIARGKTIIAAGQESGLGRLIRRYGEDRADLLAAAVAFNAVFSVFPIILGVLAIVGLVLRSPDAQARAQALILSTVPAEGAASVVQVISVASQSAGLFGLLSLVGLLWGGSNLFGALETAFDLVYQVPTRSFVRQKLMAVGMVPLFALLIVAELVATTMAQFVGPLAQSLPMVGPGVALAVVVAGGAISLLAAFAICFAIYYVVPNVRLTASQVLPGTLFASLTLVLLTQAFPLYALYFGSFDRYGAIFGLFFLLMTWAYLVAQALMVGAELNAPFREAASE